MEWYIKVLKQFNDFSGRARRKEYWMFVLFNIAFTIVAGILDNALGLTFGESPYGPIYSLYALLIIVPAIAVTVRRLHDTGKSGWMIFIALIPFIGFIWMIVLLVTDSTLGDNEYGPNPKGISFNQPDE